MPEVPEMSSAVPEGESLGSCVLGQVILGQVILGQVILGQVIIEEFSLFLEDYRFLDLTFDY